MCDSSNLMSEIGPMPLCRMCTATRTSAYGTGRLLAAHMVTDVPRGRCREAAATTFVGVLFMWCCREVAATAVLWKEPEQNWYPLTVGLVEEMEEFVWDSKSPDLASHDELQETSET